MCKVTLILLKCFIQRKTSPLLAACKEGHTETAQLLIDKGANVNQLDKVSFSPS